MRTVDVLIVGAGAAGMMCAIEAARRGRSVRIVDHAHAPGEKIRISGGLQPDRPSGNRSYEIQVLRQSGAV
ncbi:MAG: FAD-dependent oxidoreductase, partial [Brevundimonas sp.]